eukprot:superscaffoldBa00005002_g19766
MQLYKHIARVFQILNLENDELDHLAKLLGHDIRADRDYYRLPEAAVELAKIAKLLLAMEKGSLERFKGNSLEEIEIEDELESDVEQGIPDNADAEEDNEESDCFPQQSDVVAQQGIQLTPEQDALEHIKACRDKPSLEERFIDPSKVKKISAGEEITYNYGDSSHPWRSRVEDSAACGSAESCNDGSFISNTNQMNNPDFTESDCYKEQSIVQQPTDASCVQQEDKGDDSPDGSDSDGDSTHSDASSQFEDPYCSSNRNFCYVCGESKTKIARHLYTHKDEEADIAAVFALPRNSKERKRLLYELRNRGNYKHNQEVLQSHSGQLKLAKLLGCDIRTDKDYYQSPEAAVDIAKISVLLSATENGSLEKFQGKSLEEIEIPDKLEPEVEQDNPKNSDAEDDNEESESSLQLSDTDEDTVRNVENNGAGDTNSPAATPVRTDVKVTRKRDKHSSDNKKKGNKQTPDIYLEDTMDTDTLNNKEKEDQKKGGEENNWMDAMQMTCSHCKKNMILGQKAYQKKGFTDVFCSKSCLLEMFPVVKTVTKTCHYCLKAISQLLDLIMAAVDINGTMKDFCSQACLSSFKSNPASTRTPQSICSKCNKFCTSTCELTLDEAVHKFCSDACLESFCRDNMVVCENCSCYCHKKPLVLKMEEGTKTICSENCLNEFKE